MPFDLLVKGGEVIDPGGGHHGRLDVGVRDGRVAAVDRDLPAEAAGHVLDAAGHLVTPGLVDLHTHVYPGVSYWGVDADALAARGGVTTLADAGSAGAYTLPGLRRLVVEAATVRIMAFLNIAAVGLVARDGELADLSVCDDVLAATVAAANADLVRGVKVRMCTPTVGANGLAPLRRALAAADRAGLPVMTHISFAPPEIDEVVELLRTGDILTHCLTGATMRITQEGGALRESVARARDRGVVLDVGHGSGSFAFDVAEPLVAAGVWPDVISSDAHQLSVNGPMFDLPTCMSKLIALGMPLPDVVRAATSRPAEILGLAAEGVGTLRVGAPADIAVLSRIHGEVDLYDAHLDHRRGSLLLAAAHTIVAGRELPAGPPPPAAPWVPLTPAQRAWREVAAREATLAPPALRLRMPADFGPPVPRRLPSDPDTGSR